MAEVENDPVQFTAGGNLNVQTENIAFDPAKMIACGGCKRMNPPNRVACLYCARELDVALENVDVTRLNLRKAEDWEPGFNVVLLSSIDPDSSDVKTIAKVAQTGPEHVRTIAATGRPMPIVRAGSQKEAEIVRDMLGQNNIRSVVIADEILMQDRPPTRLRSAEFRDGSVVFIDFNTGRPVEIVREDITLIVKGLVNQTEIDQLEKKRRGKESKVIEAVEASSDMPILDIYDRRDPLGYRVMLSGFDFSCLENDKSLLAVENLGRLAARLRAFAPDAKFIDDYLSVRQALSSVWEIAQRKDSQGMQRSGFAKFEFGNKLSSSNLRQMNKFSRLQWHLL